MGVFFVTKFHFTESHRGIHLNTWKYNVCSIKLETKVMGLLKIRVEKISLFFSKYSCCL